MEETKYYIRVKNKNVGPLSYDEMVTKIKSEELKGDDYTFAVGSPGWVQIKTIVQFSTFISPQVSANPVNKEEQEVWFVHKNKENLGPFSVKKIAAMIKDNDLDISDYVFRKGISGWTQIKEITEITNFLKDDKNDEQSLQKIEEASSPSTGDTAIVRINPSDAAMPSPADADIIENSNMEENVNMTHEEHNEAVAQSNSENYSPVKNNFPELIFGIMLIFASLINMSISFLASVLVAFIGVGFVSYYFVKNRKVKKANV